MEGVFRESKGFFNLPIEEKMALLRRDLLGYTPLYAEKLDPSLSSIGSFILICLCFDFLILHKSLLKV